MTEGRRAEKPGQWLPDEARLIALVRDAGGDEWAAGVAVGLADMVGRERGRTFLANVARGGDELDVLLGVDGGPGLTLALTGAAAVASVARSRPDQKFAYLPAGDGALPYSGLRRMQTFRQFLGKLRAGGGTLLLYVSEDDLATVTGAPVLPSAAPPSAAPPSAARACDIRLDGCIALGAVGRPAPELGGPLLARVERPGPPPPSSVSGPPSASSTARGTPTAISAAWSGAGPHGRPGSAHGRPGSAHALGSLSRIWIPLGVLLLLWGAWALARPDPGDDVAPPTALEAGPGTDAGMPARAGVGSTGTGPGPGHREAARETADGAEADSPATPSAAGAYAAPAARYSVLVGSYIRLRDAMQRRAELGDEGGLFYVSPTPVRGRVYYRVLAGVHEDRTDAAAAMEALVEDGRKETVKQWDVRPVRLAYLLGTFATRDSAGRRTDALREAGIPAYVLRDTAEVPMYRVYAGAFESERDAVPLGQRLESHGEGTELITRSGIAP